MMERSDNGVSATKEGVEEDRNFCGVGSSSRISTGGLDSSSELVRRFLEGAGSGVSSTM